MIYELDSLLNVIRFASKLKSNLEEFCRTIYEIANINHIRPILENLISSSIFAFNRVSHR